MWNIFLYKSKITIHDPILFRVEDKFIETTPGRVILWSRIPKDPQVTFDLINVEINKAKSLELLIYYHIYCGDEKTLDLAEEFKNLGFEYAFKSGATFSKEDLYYNREKGDLLIEKGIQIYNDYSLNYLKGVISFNEFSSKVKNLIYKIIDPKSNELIQQEIKNNPLGCISLGIRSGARGSVSVIAQLKHLRGLSKTQGGKVSVVPSFDNFRDGLRIFNYIEATKSARKGGTDRAVSTATTGYLTRKMVNVAQDCIINQFDCGTDLFLKISNVIIGSKLQSSVFDSLKGRVLGKDLYYGKELLIAKNTLVNDKVLKIIKNYSIGSAFIRSPVFCNSLSGCCVLCYGMNISTRKLISEGEAVGIIAAQSIGEPGTQLTMRTFQTGNIAKGAQSEARQCSNFKGKVKIIGEIYNEVLLSSIGTIEIYDINTDELLGSYYASYGSKIYVNNGTIVENGTLMIESDDLYESILVENEGFIKYNNLVKGITYQTRENEDEIEIIANNSFQINPILPSISIVDKDFKLVKNINNRDHIIYLTPGTKILKKNGDKVSKGEIIGKILLNQETFKDIVDGLSEVITILEGRSGTEPAVLAKDNGIIQINSVDPHRKHITLVDDQGEEIDSFTVPKGQIVNILLRDGDRVKKGDFILNGKVILQEMLDIIGLEDLTNFFINSIQSVYKSQGVPLLNVHIEVILKQMLRMVVVEDNGDSKLIIGGIYDKIKVRKINMKLNSLGLKPIIYSLKIFGISQSAKNNDSFLAAAAFQEPVNALVEAASHFSKDGLQCNMSSMMANTLIKSGTGYVIQKLKQIKLNQL